MTELKNMLARRRVEGLFRERQVLDSPQGTRVHIDGEPLLSFCSNDYLGLANHPQVIAAFKAGADRYGVGAGASHLITGHTGAHHSLEKELAEFVGAERALVFSTGYMANIGVVNALADRHSLICEDKLNHASLIDAARIPRARVQRYPHLDMVGLEACLAAGAAGKLITTDAVFSMDGDLAPLPKLVDLAARHGARILADDAHGLGVLGEGGGGSLAHWGLPLRPPLILMGTLGKALGTFGAFVAGEDDLIETLIQQARTYIYTTALPPAVAEATRVSLRIARTDEWRRTRLQELVKQFRQGIQQLGFDISAGPSAIQPLILGSADRALAASRQLLAAGILVPAIRPPTVPKGVARLRITLSAAHEPEDVTHLLEALSQIRT